MTNPLLNLIIAGLAALVGLWLFWPGDCVRRTGRGADLALG
jgi:hypothetical protein